MSLFPQQVGPLRNSGNLSQSLYYEARSAIANLTFGNIISRTTRGTILGGNNRSSYPNVRIDIQNPTRNSRNIQVQSGNYTIAAVLIRDDIINNVNGSTASQREVERVVRNALQSSLDTVYFQNEIPQIYEIHGFLSNRRNPFSGVLPKN